MSNLLFDWDVVSHSQVLAVMGRNERRMNDGSLAWDEIAFVTGDKAVLLTMNNDTDEILVDHVKKPQDDGWVPVLSLGFVVGEPLGWCWEISNYRGYSDGFALAFGDIVPGALEPKLTFLGEGSALSCFTMTPVLG